jgi:hypothetical protein
MNLIPEIVGPVECRGTAGRAKRSSTLGSDSKRAGSTLAQLKASLGGPRQLVIGEALWRRQLSQWQ